MSQVSVMIICWTIKIFGVTIWVCFCAINCFTMKSSRFYLCLKEIGLEYIFFFGNIKYLFQPFLGNIKHDLRRAAGPPNKGDNLFHSCRLHWRIDYWTLHHLFKPFTWAGNIKSFLSSFYTTTFHLHEQWPYKHSSFFIFPDLFLRQTHKLLIW